MNYIISFEYNKQRWYITKYTIFTKDSKTLKNEKSTLVISVNRNYF